MTLYGWDMSHYDAPAIGNAVSEGISFITHKAGGDANDNEIDEWWQGVRGLRSRIVVGAYWVLYPGNPVGRADAFIARLDAACPSWRDTDFILQVDCEKWKGNPDTVPNKANIKAFCDRLRVKAPKLMPIVYAPKWVYEDSLKGLAYPLWASSYVSGPAGFKDLYPGNGSVRWGGYSGQVPAILQYTSSATIGGQSTCDANAYRGTLAEFKKLVSPGFHLGGKMYPQTPVIGDYTAPVLKLGNNDADFDGYNGVHRLQALLNYTVAADLLEDGDYGEKTQAAIKELMGGGDGKTVDLDEWLKLFGLNKK